MELIPPLLGTPAIESGLLGVPSWVILSGAGLAIGGILDFFGDGDDGSSDGDSMEGEMMFDDDGDMDDDLDDDLDGDLGMDGLEDDGDFDDVDMDMGGGGGAGAGGGGNGQLENRVDELENEMADLSSTVSTVRSENEEISDTVNEVEENVRKLLDIYEMVTKGVNPFVDDAQMGAGGGPMGDDSFSVFDTGDDEAGDNEGEELDSSIAEADAESFFDEEMMEPDAEDTLDDSFETEDNSEDIEMDADVSNDLFDDSDDAFEDTSSGSDDSSGGGGKSFDELKAEYESGDADWADEDGDDDLAETDTETGTDEEIDQGDDDFAEAFDTDEESALDDESDTSESNEKSMTVNQGIDALDDVDDGTEVGAQDDTEATTPPPEEEEEEEAAITESSEVDPESESFEFVDDPESGSPTSDIDDDSDSDRPYLNDLPSGYHTDLLVLEWLEYLLMESSMREAMETVRYYEDINWISGDVGDHLQETLLGLDGYTRMEADGGAPGRGLTREHHAESLRYISRLSASSPGTAVLNNWLEHSHTGGRRDRSGGGADGL